MIKHHKLRFAALCLAGASATLSGCGLLTLIVNSAKKNSVNMDKWEVKTLSVGLRDHEGVCPRDPVQVAVFADAKHKKRKNKEKRLETWKGDAQRANRIGKMGFEEFEFTLKGGQLAPETGIFTPDHDMLATAAGGFSIGAKYKRDPKVKPVEVHYAPSYDCITSGGGAGMSGSSGQRGSSGNNGAAGSSGGSSGAGGPGGPGTSGGAAGNGGDGGPGPNIVAYATLVRTPHHDHLVLLKITGDLEDTVLFDPNRPFVLSATGGAGGSGGTGGSGGRGGSGGSGWRGGTGGVGGPGGPGGIGGVGGPGGTIQLIYDPAYPELAQVISLDVSGGVAGMAGSPGPGGQGGTGGSPMGENSTKGTDGTRGSDGPGGQRGSDGPPGRASARPGDVSHILADLPEGITPA